MVVPTKPWTEPRLLNISPVICTQAGGGKPRVCSCTFDFGVGFMRHGLCASLSADIPGADHQTDAATQRKVGRACVPVGLRFAKDIIAGGVDPEYEVNVARNGRAHWKVLFERVEEVGLLRRYARVWFVTSTDGPLERPDAKVRAAGEFLKGAAESLHGYLG